MNESLRQSLNPELQRDNNADVYVIDGKTPDMVLKPRDVRDVSDILTAARSTATPLIPAGGGTRLHIGRVPDTYVCALDLSGLNRIIEYDPDELLVIAEPGVTLETLNGTLCEQGQFLPLNPPFPGQATVGGTVASNASGLLAESYGPARKYVLGLHAVYTDGVEARSGGITAKNVAGYDLKKLLAGSWGTIGIITRIMLRTGVQPESSKTVIAGFDSLDGAVQAAFDLSEKAFRPTFTAILNKSAFGRISVDPGGSDWYVFFGADGIGGRTAWAASETERACAALGSASIETRDGERNEPLRTAMRDFPSAVYPGNLIRMQSVRSGVKKTVAAALDAGLSGDSREIDVCSFYGSGVTYAGFPDGDVEETAGKLRTLFDGLKSEGVYAILDKAPPELKKTIDVWPEFPGLDLMRKIKREYDPENILNPGRFIR